MIIDNPNSKFIFIYSPLILMGRKYTVYNGKELTNAEILEYWGKWLVLDHKENLDELAKKLDPYVENKKIPCIKYDREPPRLLGLEECVMMAYCDRRQRDDVWEILSSFGIRLKAWVTEKETMDLWKPGGILLEMFLEKGDFDEKTKKMITEDAKSRMNYIYDHPDEIFIPWGQ